jgi:2-oxoglutarate ferredoxin oxidoreductase subunit alpha
VRAASSGTTSKLDRGKVMTRRTPRGGAHFGRYLDVDGDGIPIRTYPGTHPTKGSFFTRGTTQPHGALFRERRRLQDNMERC